MESTLFHGSGVTVETPEIRIVKYTKDFGYGCYCTKLYTQAERWALRHNDESKGEVPSVNLYRYEPTSSLSVKVFDKMTDEWLDFIAMCRHSEGCTPHKFDIVEGPMADDQVWNFVEDFLNGQISRSQFWALTAFKQPTHQVSFHTKAALDCLHFERVITVDESKI